MCSQYFHQCAEFIDRALGNNFGQVYVASMFGVSRSAAIVTAFLMLKRKVIFRPISSFLSFTSLTDLNLLLQMSASQAMQIMRRSREIRPNTGFLRQLGELDDKLRKNRYRY